MFQQPGLATCPRSAQLTPSRSWDSTSLLCVNWELQPYLGCSSWHSVPPPTEPCPDTNWDCLVQTPKRIGHSNVTPRLTNEQAHLPPHPHKHQQHMQQRRHGQRPRQQQQRVRQAQQEQTTRQKSADVSEWSHDQESHAKRQGNHCEMRKHHKPSHHLKGSVPWSNLHGGVEKHVGPVKLLEPVEQQQEKNNVKPLLPVRPVMPLSPVRLVELAPHCALGQWLLRPTNAADKEGGATLMPHSIWTKQSTENLFLKTARRFGQAEDLVFAPKNPFLKSFLCTSFAHEGHPNFVDVKATPCLDPVVPAPRKEPRWPRFIRIALSVVLWTACEQKESPGFAKPGPQPLGAVTIFGFNKVGVRTRVDKGVPSAKEGAETGSGAGSSVGQVE